MWHELQSSTQNIYSDIVKDLMSRVDESELVRKKREYALKGIKLRTHVKTLISVITTAGQVSYDRYYLIPQSNESKEKPIKQAGTKSIIPLYCHLGLAEFPFKITPKAMLKVVFWCRISCRFKEQKKQLMR